MLYNKGEGGPDRPAPAVTEEVDHDTQKPTGSYRRRDVLPYDRPRRGPAGASGRRRGESGPSLATGQAGATSYTAEQEYLFDIIKNRRTVRDFKPTPVPKEHILKILDMARSAPTSGNQQPWKFLVVQDRAKLDRLKVEAVAWFLAEYEKRRKPAPEDTGRGPGADGGDHGQGALGPGLRGRPDRFEVGLSPG